jgi:hypothetical protein
MDLSAFLLLSQSMCRLVLLTYPVLPSQPDWRGCEVAIDASQRKLERGFGPENVCCASYSH